MNLITNFHFALLTNCFCLCFSLFCLFSPIDSNWPNGYSYYGADQHHSTKCSITHLCLQINKENVVKIKNLIENTKLNFKLATN